MDEATGTNRGAFARTAPLCYDLAASGPSWLQILETAIWERVIDPNDDDISRRRLDFSCGSTSRKRTMRMQEFAQKSDEGTLTADERLELQNYVRIGNVLALMQSKARLSLGHTARAS